MNAIAAQCECSSDRENLVDQGEGPAGRLVAISVLWWVTSERSNDCRHPIPCICCASSRLATGESTSSLCDGGTPGVVRPVHHLFSVLPERVGGHVSVKIEVG